MGWTRTLMTLVGPTSDFPVCSDNSADPTSLDRTKGETDHPISRYEMYERLRGDQ
jgi:hypothetical protein